MTFTPRQYQTESIDAAEHFMRHGRGNGLLVLPTGSGKSLVIAGLVERLNEPALVFQPSKEILEQNYEKLVAFGIRPAVYSASLGRKERGNIVLATIGSVRKSPEMFAHVKHILVDECHLVNAKGGMYSNFFAAVGQQRILGLTATPYRLSTDGYGGSILKFLTRTRPRVFSEVVHVVQTSTLFDAGYLAKLVYKPVAGFDRAMLKTNSTGADYTDDSVRDLFGLLNWGDRIVKCVERLWHYGRRNALVFTRFIEEAKYVSSRIPGSAVVCNETTPADRERILREFKAGSIKCVVNVGVLVVGFDFPELDSVVLAAPTMSLARYYQMVGRVVRTSPLKQDAWVIDMVQLVEQFGRVEDLHLEDTGNAKWVVRSTGKQLTNVYFGEPYKKAA